MFGMKIFHKKCLITIPKTDCVKCVGISICIHSVPSSHGPFRDEKSVCKLPMDHTISRN